jgi:hypothetical protein
MTAGEFHELTNAQTSKHHLQAWEDAKAVVDPVFGPGYWGVESDLNMANLDSLSEILSEFYDGNLTWIQLPPMIVDVLSEQNVDSVLLQLPEDIRIFFLDYVRHTYVADNIHTVTIGRGEAAPVSRSGILAIRGWLERNPV